MIGLDNNQVAQIKENYTNQLMYTDKVVKDMAYDLVASGGSKGDTKDLFNNFCSFAEKMEYNHKIMSRLLLREDYDSLCVKLEYDNKLLNRLVGTYNKIKYGKLFKLQSLCVMQFESEDGELEDEGFCFNVCEYTEKISDMKSFAQKKYSEVRKYALSQEMRSAVDSAMSEIRCAEYFITKDATGETKVQAYNTILDNVIRLQNCWTEVMIYLQKFFA